MGKRVNRIRAGWSALLILGFFVAGACGQTATHSSSYFYSAPGTYTVTNYFYYPETEQLTSLNWWPDVPTGWTITNLRGSNGPILYYDMGYYIFGWSGGPYPNPLIFYYDITIPAGVTGDQQIPSAFWYNTAEVPPTGYSQPDPLVIHQPRSILGFVFHEEDNNGIYDTWDTPVTNITVRLLEGGTTNLVAAPVVTDADGYYSFGGLPDGDYDVMYWVKTNHVTILPGGSDTNRNQLVPMSDMIIPVSITSATNVHVNVGMTGSGPMSSAIDLRAYRGADGAVVEFVAHDVEQDANVVLYLLGPGGTVLWSGTNAVQAGAQQFCRFQVPGLVVGGIYQFGVLDEVGQYWTVSGVQVTPFSTEMIRMTLAGITLAFDSLPEREYEIQWVPRLGQTWRTVTNVVALSERTLLVVRHPDPASPSGFFRIRLK